MPHPVVTFTACFSACLLLAATAAGQSPPTSAEDRRALRRTPVVEVFEATRDSVVNISSTQIVQVRTPMGIEGLFDDLFGMPGRPRTRELRRTSVGSGFVIHAEGYVVTNAHVVARTAERRVIFADRRSYSAEIVAMDIEHDLAVLKFDPTQPPMVADDAGETLPATDPPAPRPIVPLALGTSSDLMVGETVIAIGNPFGFQHTVTAGVVSALDRNLDINEQVRFRGLIQTDASINPGNSGGPLLNIFGELVGINTAIRADADNIGFAIPVDQLRAMLPTLLDIERRYGIRTGVTLGEDGSLTIAQVQPDSPAAAAGLKPGQVIRRVAGRDVRLGFEFFIALIGQKPGQSVEVTVAEADTLRTVRMTLAKRPRPNGDKLLVERFGIEAEPVDARLARALNMPGLRGMQVNTVEWRSPAEKIGLRRGDIIVQIGRHPAAAFDDVGELLEQVRPGQTVDLTVLRISRNTVYRVTTRLQAR